MTKIKAKIQTKTRDGESKRQWLESLERLMGSIESWCSQNGWATAREKKPLEESKLGKYNAPVLKVRSPRGIVYVEPVARFVAAADGLVDLYGWPTMRRMLLVKKGRGWVLKTDSGVPWPHPWSKEVFLSVIPALAA